MALTGFCDLAAKLTIVAGSAQHKLSQELAEKACAEKDEVRCPATATLNLSRVTIFTAFSLFKA
jgi:hypothetical protein